MREGGQSELEVNHQQERVWLSAQNSSRQLWLPWEGTCYWHQRYTDAELCVSSISCSKQFSFQTLVSFTPIINEAKVPIQDVDTLLD